MLQRLKRIPHPGLRNIKTCIAIVITLILYRVINRTGVTLALVAGIICMQDSIDKSINLGIARAKGTAMGGLLGVIFVSIGLHELQFPLFLISIFLCNMIFIFLCNLLNSKSSIVIGCIVFLIIVIDSETIDSPTLYAINRTLDTLIGIVIAFAVNQLIYRPRPDSYRGMASINPFFNYEIHHIENQKVLGWRDGITTELYIYPEDSLCEDRKFDFRLSHTVVEMEKSSFYKYPGYKRHVMLLDGELQLAHFMDGKLQHSKVLSKYEVDFFKSEWDTSCKGKFTNLCLLIRDDYKGIIETVYTPDIFTLKNDSFEGFYILEDNTKVTFCCQDKEHREILNKGDFVMVGWYLNGPYQYTVSFSNDQLLLPNTVSAIKISCSKIEGN